VDEPVKKPKKKGPIRTEAIIPLGVIVALVMTYFTLFFDWQLRKGIEIVGTVLNGAEVNIGNLETSFLKASFLAEEIELTDSEDLTKNRLQIGKIHYNLLWDALLRAKFVINLAGINDIRVNTPRKTPGKPLDPATAARLGFIKSKITETAKEELADSPLADVAKILEGFDPSSKLKELTNLESLARIEELETQLDQKEKEWTKSIKSFPPDKEFTGLQKKIKSIKIGGNPASARKGISQATSSISEATGKIKEVSSKASSLQNDMSGFGNSIGQIDNLIAKDLKNQQKKLNLPSLDSSDISKQIFGKSLLSKVEQAEKYKAMVEEKMPPKKDEQKKEEPKRKRGIGKNYRFGRQNSYPSFWLKKAEINSKSDGSPYMGDIDGVILNVCNNQPHLGLPATMNVKGSFPAQNIYNLSLKVVIDHRKPISNDSATIKVGSFPVQRKMFSDSDSLKFGIERATGASITKFSLKGDKISLRSKNKFRKAQYIVQSKTAVLEEVIKNALKSIPVLTVDAVATGNLDHLNWSITSNLGAALQKGFSGVLNAKLSATRKKIKAMIDGKVGARKKKLTGRFNGVKSKFTSQIEGKKKKAEQTKQLAQNKLNEAKKKLTSAKGPAKKALSGIKKKFGF